MPRTGSVQTSHNALRLHHLGLLGLEVALPWRGSPTVFLECGPAPGKRIGRLTLQRGSEPRLCIFSLCHGGKGGNVALNGVGATRLLSLLAFLPGFQLPPPLR